MGLGGGQDVTATPLSDAGGGEEGPERRARGNSRADKQENAGYPLSHLLH